MCKTEGGGRREEVGTRVMVASLAVREQWTGDLWTLQGSRRFPGVEHRVTGQDFCLVMIQASVYAVSRGTPYTRGFSVSGTLSAPAPFLFPEQQPWCHAPRRPARIRKSETGRTTSSTSL